MNYKKVTVAGGGVLGSQIAFQIAYSGFAVTIWLREPGSIGRCQPKLDRLKGIYLDTLEAMKTDPAAYAYGLLPRDQVTPEACEAAKARVEKAYADLKLTTSYEEAFSDADFVIESIAENPQEKIALYTEMAKHLPEKTVVATNSSTMLPSTFASYTGRPEKYLALHFANNIWKQPTAEVMVHAGTDPRYFDEVFEFAQAIRMVPLKVMKEQPGYLLNSMLVPFLGAAEYLWAEGIGTPEDIDLAWTMSTGAPNGPFRILDVVGLTTAYNIGMMKPGADDPTTPQGRICALLKEKIDRGELGVNAGKGFYDYTK
ncbi:3-hydroxyacyl-CoA dehydrogenase [Coriobacteriales bacterium OH1046]|nr:3-hydroxyacyl-CoA dehydrogenase [Coriobacteriales bacterium OH1046]